MRWVIEEVKRDPNRTDWCGDCGEKFPETELRQVPRPIGKTGVYVELVELCAACLERSKEEPLATKLDPGIVVDTE